MTTRTNLRPWPPSHATLSLPPSCSTAAALSSGHTCRSSTALPIPTCFPWGTPGTLSSISTFYSPATACPPGYDYDPTHTRTTPLSYPRSAVSEDEWIAGETAVYCCPDGYSWSDVASMCRLRFGGVVVNANCSAGGKLSTMTLSEIGDPVRAVAAGMQFRFQESDGKFEKPRGTGVVATVTGGGDGPAETKGPEGGDGGVLETGGGDGGGGGGGGGGEATGTVGGTGGAGRGARGGKMGVVMVMVLSVVAGMVIL